MLRRPAPLCKSGDAGDGLLSLSASPCNRTRAAEPADASVRAIERRDRSLASDAVRELAC